MAKSRVSYLCRQCGGVQAQWMGKCPDCGTWDALEKYIEPKAPKSGASGMLADEATGEPDARVSRTPVAEPLTAVKAGEVSRLSTGIGELDRVLGGGLVPGSAVLVGGDPGIGKSTLLLQAAARLAQGAGTGPGAGSGAGPGESRSAGRPILYVSSEESAYQTRLRAERLFGDGERDREGRRGRLPHQGESEDGRRGRLRHQGRLPRTADTEDGLSGLDNLYLLADTNLARIIEQTRKVNPAVVIVDSIQMIHRPDLEAAPGSVAQLRRCCLELVHLAKVSGMAVILVGHVTKEGILAGPKLVEHLVDTVLTFEGDRHHAHRVVRAIKNRFGTTLEVALFEMTGSGLREVEPGAILHDLGQGPRPGSIVCPAMHGSRCLLVEVQALTAPGFLGNARRKASGLDGNRLAMLIAVLEKHGGLRLADQDVFVSTTGGLKVVEPAADLALCLAIAGAFQGRAIGAGETPTAVVGEVGLGGEVRRAPSMEARLMECARLGYRRVLTPRSVRDVPRVRGVDVVAVGSVSEAMEHLDVAASVTRARSSGRGSAVPASTRLDPP